MNLLLGHDGDDLHPNFDLLLPAEEDPGKKDQNGKTTLNSSETKGKKDVISGEESDEFQAIIRKNKKERKEREIEKQLKQEQYEADEKKDAAS